MSPMISYAQNFEDVVLARAFAGQNTGFYVDVGACDPLLRSVTKHFYDEGWRGVNVEPTTRFHSALLKQRGRDVNLRVAVGSGRDTLTFYEFDAEGISTLNQEFAAHFERKGFRCTKRSVSVLPLREICEAHCSGPIDFMKVDVEGWEQQVLEGGDWRRFRPRVLLVEATLPNSREERWQEWEPFLLRQEYLFAYFDGLNRFYVSREEEGLLRHFAIPPNIHDEFEAYETARLREELSLCRNALDKRGLFRLTLLRAVAAMKHKLQRSPPGR